MSEGALFSQYFMDEGIVQSTDWQSIDADKLDKARALILAGIEDFDARQMPEGWLRADFDDSGWDRGWGDDAEFDGPDGG